MATAGKPKKAPSKHIVRVTERLTRSFRNAGMELPPQLFLHHSTSGVKLWSSFEAAPKSPVSFLS